MAVRLGLILLLFLGLTSCIDYSTDGVGNVCVFVASSGNGCISNFTEFVDYRYQIPGINVKAVFQIGFAKLRLCLSKRFGKASLEYNTAHYKTYINYTNVNCSAELKYAKPIFMQQSTSGTTFSSINNLLTTKKPAAQDSTHDDTAVMLQPLSTQTPNKSSIFRVIENYSVSNPKYPYPKSSTIRYYKGMERSSSTPRNIPANAPANTGNKKIEVSGATPLQVTSFVVVAQNTAYLVIKAILTELNVYFTELNYF